MTDRFLFRGKDRDTKEWRVGCLSWIAQKAYIDTTPTDGGKFNARVDPATVGQCTGLTDKNGTKIFEGDIVRGEKTHIVEWQCDYHCEFGVTGYRWIVRNLPVHEWKQEFFPLGEFNRKTIEVIGNIHDNPELLKGAK